MLIVGIILLIVGVYFFIEGYSFLSSAKLYVLHRKVLYIDFVSDGILDITEGNGKNTVYRCAW